MHIQTPSLRSYISYTPIDSEVFRRPTKLNKQNKTNPSLSTNATISKSRQNFQNYGQVGQFKTDEMTIKEQQQLSLELQKAILQVEKKVKNLILEEQRRSKSTHITKRPIQSNPECIVRDKYKQKPFQIYRNAKKGSYLQNHHIDNSHFVLSKKENSYLSSFKQKIKREGNDRAKGKNQKFELQKFNQKKRKAEELDNL